MWCTADCERQTLGPPECLQLWPSLCFGALMLKPMPPPKARQGHVQVQEGKAKLDDSLFWERLCCCSATPISSPSGPPERRRRALNRGRQGLLVPRCLLVVLYCTRSSYCTCVSRSLLYRSYTVDQPNATSGLDQHSTASTTSSRLRPFTTAWQRARIQRLLPRRPVQETRRKAGGVVCVGLQRSRPQRQSLQRHPSQLQKSQSQRNRQSQWRCQSQPNHQSQQRCRSKPSRQSQQKGRSQPNHQRRSCHQKPSQKHPQLRTTKHPQG